MSVRTLHISAAFAATVLCLPGCTVVGTVLSPITGPIDVVRRAIEGSMPAKDLWVLPIMIVLSPLAGLISGIRVDAAIVADGRWDLMPAVLRPWVTSFTRTL